MDNRVSIEQLDLLLSCLEMHPGMCKSTTSMGPRDRIVWDKAWNQLAEKLNAVQGCVKSGHRWKRYWACIKFRAKLRRVGKKNNAGDLSRTDRRILDIVGLVSESNSYVANEATLPQPDVPDPIDISVMKEEVCEEDETGPPTCLLNEDMECQSSNTQAVCEEDETASPTSPINEDVECQSSNMKQEVCEEDETASPKSPINEDVECQSSNMKREVCEEDETAPPTSPIIADVECQSSNMKREVCEEDETAAPTSPINEENPTSQPTMPQPKKLVINKIVPGCRKLTLPPALELERRRVAAEEKMAEAMRMFAQAAKITAEASCLQAKAHLDLVNLLKSWSRPANVGGKVSGPNINLNL